MQVQSLVQEDPLEKERAVNPLQYSCLDDPMGRGVWQATVHSVAESDITESTYAHTHTYTYTHTLTHTHTYFLFFHPKPGSLPRFPVIAMPAPSLRCPETQEYSRLSPIPLYHTSSGTCLIISASLCMSPKSVDIPQALLCA